ncbi:MAG: inorganic phosphate transporter [Candidatus Marisimplicoccus sp.]
MESIYIIITGIIVILAISDLIVGVSNDAVNFLNSAIGSKVISFKNIMILASFGVALGALSSSGMMEIARKGIFNPQFFFFDEIMIIFLSVMITDILILDTFNSWGIPTSTTVSIVFELLGAAVIMSLIKIISSDSATDINIFINTQKASQIIFGILLSVFVAFSIGAVIQWISRLILSFNFESKSLYINSIIGSLSFSSIINFILIKGIKGSPYSKETYDVIGGLTINNFIDNNIIQFWMFSLLFWYIFSVILIKLLRIDIYKIIIAIGTFSLALAFAGNDLVNFVGVPIAALEAYNGWVGSGISANEFSMSILAEKVQPKPIYLFVSGLIMVVTLLYSSKAKNVVKTSLDLSNQNIVDERFNSNLIGVSLVNIGRGLNNIFIKLAPKSLLNKIEKSFNTDNVMQFASSPDRPSFDKLRASLNLVIAAILISLATSYKLPLSTTYVTFMVAMGTSLSDRAWGKESAVYRVSGVVNVIGSWFLTAFAAFSLCGLIVFLIHIGGTVAIIVIIIASAALIYRNHIMFKKKGEIKI